MIETLLAAPLPQPLAAHFKRIESVGALFESMPLDYVRQCIEQTALTPFERAALLALFDRAVLQALLETMETEK